LGVAAAFLGAVERLFRVGGALFGVSSSRGGAVATAEVPVACCMLAEGGGDVELEGEGVMVRRIWTLLVGVGVVGVCDSVLSGEPGGLCGGFLGSIFVCYLLYEGGQGIICRITEVCELD
jgi:hypothetical protein